MSSIKEDTEKISILASEIRQMALEAVDIIHELNQLGLIELDDSESEVEAW